MKRELCSFVAFSSLPRLSTEEWLQVEGRETVHCLLYEPALHAITWRPGRRYLRHDRRIRQQHGQQSQFPF